MRKLIVLATIYSIAFGDKILTFKIPNMACISCYETILTTLYNIKGIKKSDVNLEQKSATVVVDDDFNAKVIIQALKQNGYEAKIIGE